MTAVTKDIVLSKDGDVITMCVSSFEMDITKTWTMNNLATTPSQQASTQTTTTYSAGAIAIAVSSTTNFKKNDVAMIYGFDSGGTYHTDYATIKSVTTSTIMFYTGLNWGYVAGAIVTKQGGMTVSDFNNNLATMTAQCYITASAEDNAEEVRTKLWNMAFGGGSVAVVYGVWRFPEVAIQKINIKEVPNDISGLTSQNMAYFEVILTFVPIAVPMGERNT